MGLFLSRAASRTEGDGLNLDEMQCSKNMMHKANHECILLLGSSVDSLLLHLSSPQTAYHNSFTVNI